MTLAEYYKFAEEIGYELHKALSALQNDFAIDLQKARKNHKNIKVLKTKLQANSRKVRYDYMNQLEIAKRKVW